MIITQMTGKIAGMALSTLSSTLTNATAIVLIWGLNITLCVAIEHVVGKTVLSSSYVAPETMPDNTSQ